MTPTKLKESLNKLLNKQGKFSPDIQNELRKIVFKMERMNSLDDKAKAQFCMKMIEKIRKPNQDNEDSKFLKSS